jgi:hypothetical protein
LHLDTLFAIHSSLETGLGAIGVQARGAAGDVKTAPVRVQVSEVGWDPDLLRLEYLADDGEPIRCVIARSQE